MKKRNLFKGVICGFMLVAVVGATVYAGTVSLSATMDSDYKRVAFSYTPPASTFQEVELSGYQYHSQSGHYTIKTATRTAYGANKFNDSFTSMIGYVYLTDYAGVQLTLTGSSDGVLQATVYPE